MLKSFFMFVVVFVLSFAVYVLVGYINVTIKKNKKESELGLKQIKSNNHSTVTTESTPTQGTQVYSSKKKNKKK